MLTVLVVVDWDLSTPFLLHDRSASASVRSDTFAGCRAAHVWVTVFFHAWWYGT
jgi:hypothetical protein